jgi:hypothetical protein
MILECGYELGEIFEMDSKVIVVGETCRDAYSDPQVWDPDVVDVTVHDNGSITVHDWQAVPPSARETICNKHDVRNKVIAE